MAVYFGVSGHSVSLLAVTVVLALKCSTGGEAAFNVSLEIQGHCSDQLTLICRHSNAVISPLWIHNGTLESGQLLGTAFPGAVYTVLTRTVHVANITGTDNVRVLHGYLIQCAYNVLGNLIKSNAVQYSFTPPDYQPALSLVSLTANLSDRLSTFNYSYQNSCTLFSRCTPYFSVEHTVSPQSVVSNTSSGCSVEYTILNLTRCVSYQSTGITLLGNQRGNTVVVGTTVMLSPGRFTITSVTVGVGRGLINVTFVQYEPDCPGYPTERYTVDVDGVQVADLTADEVQSRITDFSNGFATLSLPLTQRLSESAVTVNMTKFNTVPTNRSDDMGNIVTEMVTWGTSAVFDIQQVTPQPTFPSSTDASVLIATTAFLVALWVATMTIFGIVTAVLCSKIHNLKQNVSHQKSPSPPLPSPGISTGDPTLSADPTPSADPNTIQLQPNPSYCLLEMSHQQPKSNRLENEAKYINL